MATLKILLMFKTLMDNIHVVKETTLSGKKTPGSSD